MMKEPIEMRNLYEHETDAYNLEGFKPQIVDAEYLKQRGVTIEPSDETLQGLIRGSKLFMKRLEEHTVIPKSMLYLEDCDPNTIETEIHNYTGRCPTLTFEVNPIKGCHVGCQYCLVTDGVHEQKLVAYENYHLYVRKLLEEMNGACSEQPNVVTPEDIKERSRLLQELANAIVEAPEKKKDIERQIVALSRGKNWNHYYYFTPKTEALQEPTLYTGIAHRILREFIAHFKRYPNSNARLFIASKAGTKHLLVENEGETILDLFEQLKDKMQFNTSVSIMPKAFRDLLEPYAAPIEERMAAVKMCQERGIQANSALVQPIFVPYLTDEHIKEFFDMLHDAGIVNYKPEFLTACMENLAQLGQWLGHFDKTMERDLYMDYISPKNADHRKQRGRTAPNRALSIENIQRLMKYTDTIGMSTSICFWVRNQLKVPTSIIPIINRNGFQCLGYQSKLFKGEWPQDVCAQLFAGKLDYYHHWYHDRPMLITPARRDELRRMQALLYKCIVYMAEHYREWVPRYMPLDDKVMQILDYQSRYPFRAGAYRPDYLISNDGQLLLVEISSRFFGHGIWANYPAEVKAQQFMAAHPGASWENCYDELLSYMRNIVPAGTPLYVLKSSDRGSESTFYTKFYEYYGHEVTVYEAAEVEANTGKWSHDAVVFSALNQEDLLSFKMETLQAMIDARMLNDFRTIFLVHDKRFLHLIFVDDFTRECLTEEETTFLRQHTIPTYLYNNEYKEIWEDALQHKDRYILKPYDLGKSVGLYAGVMTDEETWKSIHNSQLTIHNYILQPFVKQRTYPCEWERLRVGELRSGMGKHYDEYVCGMMLCMDDRYFDSGVFRTSSAPVTNKVDDRKMCVIHSDDEVLKKNCFVL